MLEETSDREEIIERVAALDIGKAELVCCVRVPGAEGKSRRVQEVTTYQTMTRALLGMVDRLTELGVTRVVMEATSDYWKPPGAPRGATESSGGERTPPLVQSQLAGEAGGSPIVGTRGEGGSSPDNVRDGPALSDGPGPASSDEKVYARNHCLKPRKSSAGSNLADMGRCAVRGLVRWCGPGRLRSRLSGPVGRPR